MYSNKYRTINNKVSPSTKPNMAVDYGVLPHIYYTGDALKR